MRVTNVRVSFLREKQPAQYEKAMPEVEFAAVLDGGEDHVDVAAQLMFDATSVVYAGIGYSVPSKVGGALSAVISSDVEMLSNQTGATVESEEPKKRGRGRPKGSKTKKVEETTEEAYTPEDPSVSTEDTVVSEEEVEETFTPRDLHTMIMGLVPKRLSVANAKQILAHFKVARAQDLTNEQALEGRTMVEKMLAASDSVG